MLFLHWVTLKHKIVCLATNIIPYQRQIINFSNFNDSLYINAPGQSENIFSRHYDDLLSKWAAGKYIKISSKFAANKKNTLLLLPKAKEPKN